MQVTQIIAGDTFNPAPTVTPDYPATAGWVLTYRLVPQTAGLPVITLTCSAAGADHQPNAAASVTKLWQPGPYTWASYVERAGESYALEQGQLTILPDPRTMAAGVDGRSVAQRALEQLRAALSTYSASQGTVAEYEIAGRRMKFRAAEDIIKLIAYWEVQVANEERIAAGATPARRRILTRI
ncbi:MAG TPA: hypothetical protein P5024_11455 [Burkholderiaceae bacterium]|nr:hypothetical protein [Burkholderiaceae bacterium]HRZ59900.1 hypothetical protein [Rubrivivax sp.]